MPKDATQRAVEAHEIDVWIVGEIRRETVVQYFASRGYKILADDDPATRELFDLRTGPIADIVAEVSPNRIIIAEVKGKNISHALKQLSATAAAASKQYMAIECKIFCKYPTPPRSEFPMPGDRLGYRAVRVFKTAYPAEWLLYEYRENSDPVLVEIACNPVTIVFGPHDSTG
jgi:hypothetical protein